MKLLNFASIIDPAWAGIPLNGFGMHKLNLDFFYHLGARLNSLSVIITEPGNVYRILVSQRATQLSPALYALLNELPALNVCRGVANELLSNIDVISKWGSNASQDDWNKPDSSIDNLFIAVIVKAKELETVLRNELTTLEVYHTTQKGAYTTTDLIMQAEKTLPESALSKIDDKIIEDIRCSARCLAFDNPTASGFHILRATEAVLHQYYIAVCNPEPKPERLGSWADYIAELYKSTDPDVKKMVAVLQQMKDLDRNLIIHPEVFLSQDDAFILFEAAKYAIMQMATRLPERDIKKSGRKKANTS